MDYCFECGGKLEMKVGPDRIFTIRKGEDFILPNDFLLPTCTICGVDFINEDLEIKVRSLYNQLKK